MLMLGHWLLWLVGVGAFLGLQVWNGRTRCRVHVQHRLGVPLLWWGWPADCHGAVVLWWLVWWVVGDLYSGCEHLDFLFLWFCLVLLGIRWMPWHQELMKDVAACEMPRGVGERALIRGCPNGGT